MQFAKVQIRPGINRESTAYANTGGWYDSDKIRFRAGLPEKIGGWVPYYRSAFLGVCRALLSWSDNMANLFIAVGTNLKYYAFNGAALNDITPIRRSVTLGANPFATVSGQSTVTVTDVGHGAITNDFVTYAGASTFNNVTVSGEYQITRIDADTYTITVTTTASGTGSGGGAAVTAAYQINTGLDTTFVGSGWGAGTWSRGTWGSGADVSIAGTLLRLWTQDTYGEDLLFAYRGGPLYLYDVTVSTTRAVAISTMTGASEVPTSVRTVLVSERHVIALGTNTLFTSTEDPMLVRWSDQENYLEWNPSDDNAAGDYRLSVGSEIIGGIHGRQEILIWTDQALYSMRYIGGQFIYGFELLGDALTVAGPNAMVNVGDQTFWMGTDNFYAYNGRVQQLPCTVRDYIFQRLNPDQALKVCAGTNTKFGEVTWFYTSTDSTENDSYVTYNYVDNLWYYGSIVRTAWIDSGAYAYPLAADVATKYLYAHEFGTDDGSANPPAAITARIRSSPFEIGDGYQMGFVTRLIPDVTFRDIGSGDPSVTMTLIPQDYPGGAYGTEVDATVQRGTTVTVEQFTTQVPVRLRARSVIFEVESTGTDMSWRLGTPRLEMRPDGRRG